MRYKTLVTQKIDNIGNVINVLNSKLSQNVSRQEIDEIIFMIKEKLQDVQSLINTEREEAGSW